MTPAPTPVQRKAVRLAIEPEPLCVLETTGEAVEFFHRLWERADRAAAGEAARTHLGVRLA